jgi:thiamine biosynthesis lipoprotein
MSMAVVLLATYAMRTRFELVLVGDDEPFLRAAGEEALNEIAELERLLSRFRSDSDIGRINRFAALESVRVDARTFRLLQQAKRLWEATEGAFDITLGTWRHSQKATSLADAIFLDEAAMTVRLADEGVRLDLGGIGKGYALERAANLLRLSGVESAFLHSGTSSVFAFGCDQNGEPWRVAIAHPVNDEPIATVTLSGCGLSVSATTPAEGRRTVDPQTGEPVRRTLLAAVVLPSPTEAEAWSTALLVSGEKGLTLFQRQCPTGWALVVRSDGQIERWEGEGRCVAFACHEPIDEAFPTVEIA